MSISSVTSKVIYVGDGATATLAYPFRILAEGDLTVSRYITLTSASSLLAINTDYVVTGVGVDTGGNVLLTGSYAGGMPTGSNTIIQRVVDLTQEVDYVENDPFPAETHERALDKLCMADQQLQEQIDRAILGDINQESSNVTFTAFANQAAIATSSATVAVAQASSSVVYSTAASSSATVALNAANQSRYFRVTLIDPADVYSISPAVCILQSLNSAITVESIQITCDANPSIQISGNLLYANAFIGTASPVAIDKINTTSGVLYDASISNAAVAAGKCVYLNFDAQPTASITQLNINVKYSYN